MNHFLFFMLFVIVLGGFGILRYEIRCVIRRIIADRKVRISKTEELYREFIHNLDKRGSGEHVE